MRTVSMECIPAHTDNENSKYGMYSTTDILAHTDNENSKYGMYTCSHRQ